MKHILFALLGLAFGFAISSCSEHKAKKQELVDRHCEEVQGRSHHYSRRW